jgi:hypothetical protein
LQEGRSLSLQISQSPYDPILWHKRGSTLLELGYPELAMGDLYKCKLLCEGGLRTTAKNNQQTTLRSLVQHTVHKMISGNQISSKSPECNISAMLDTLPATIDTLLALHESSSTQLIQAMLRAKCFQDSVDLAMESSRLYPSNVDFLKQQVFAAHQLRIPLKDQSNLSSDAALMSRRCGSVFRRIYPWMTEKYFKFVILS